MIEWLRGRIKAKPQAPHRNVKHFRHDDLDEWYKEEEPKKPAAGGMFGKLFGAPKPDPKQLAELKQTQQLRDGLKLRNMVAAKMTNEIRLQVHDPENKKCIITRMIGLKDYIPGVG